MPKTTRTARERWIQFLWFVAMWSVAAVAGSALLFFFTAGSDQAEPSSPASQPEPAAEPDPLPAPTAKLAAPEPPQPAPKAPPRSPPSPRRSQARTPKRRVMTASERSAKLAEHVRAAAAASEAGDYDTAIQHCDSALELDPHNFEVEILRDQVTSLLELSVRDTERSFQESPTELTAAGVSSASTTAELFIELLPASPKPGDPYILRVRVHNESDDYLSLTSVELVDTHDSMKHERGRATRPLAERLGPNENALLLEKKGDWTLADRSGAIVVAVTLDDGSRLSKSLRW